MFSHPSKNEIWETSFKRPSQCPKIKNLYGEMYVIIQCGNTPHMYIPHVYTDNTLWLWNPQRCIISSLHKKIANAAMNSYGFPLKISLRSILICGKLSRTSTGMDCSRKKTSKLEATLSYCGAALPSPKGHHLSCHPAGCITCSLLSGSCIIFHKGKSIWKEIQGRVNALPRTLNCK